MMRSIVKFTNNFEVFPFSILDTLSLMTRVSHVAWSILLTICFLAVGFKVIRHSHALSFQKIGSILVDPPTGVNTVNQGTLEEPKKGTLIWSKPYFGVSGAMDWSPYDFVELTLYNSGTQAVSARFEVKDTQTSDYWTRVNLPQVIGPGLQTIKLPTRLRVGEPGRPGRPLDATKVTSFILAREDDKDHTPIEVRHIELKKSALGDQHEILSFDVGPEDTALFDGFQALTDKSLYDPAKTWGWIEPKFWAPYPQVNRLLAPDRLTADNLTIASATLRVDLKPGTYKVWMIIDHPGGFWGEYPYYTHRTVRAQGKLVLDERMTPAESKADYFKWQDNEDREDDNIFDRYWSSILKEKSFEVQVDGDHLKLDFENDGCPDKIPCFGMALSALVIFPVDTDEQRTNGENWLKQVADHRREEFNSHFQMKSKPLTALLKKLPSGLHAWNVSPNIDLSQTGPKDVQPFTSGGKVHLSAFKNSTVFFAPAVSWKGKTPQEITWHIEHLPKNMSVEGGWIKFRALRDSYTGNLYSVRERWVTDEKTRVFPFEDLGRVWLRFPISKNAKPGHYKAELVISASGGQVTRVPLELKVFKNGAENVDFPVGPFGSNINENWWTDSELKTRLEGLEIKSLQKMRDLGMTAFSFSPRIKVTSSNGTPSIDTREVDRVMKLARKMGFQGLVGYNDVFSGQNLCTDSAGTASDFKQVADALEARANERHWLPMTLVICDEPVGEAVNTLLDKMKAFPKFSKNSHQRKIFWSITTSLGEHETSENRKLVAATDLPFLSEFSKGDIRSPWGFYNNTSRKTLGLGMFQLRQTTDLRYRMMWVWNQNLANPFFAFDGREDDLGWCSSLENGKLRCSVESDRVIEQGLQDYRVALSLKHLLEKKPHLNANKKSQGLKLLKESQSEKVDSDAWTLQVGEYLESL
jgi:hypothetical protein